jgi:cell division protein FtsN
MIIKIQQQQQQGGTLLGFILGLIVGLAIAVAVALAISKGSTPFTNKLKNDRAVDATPMTDPNKPLYSGKDAAKQAAQEFAKDKAPTEVAATTPTTTTTPATATTAVPVEAALAGNTIDSAKADTSDDKWTYYLQVGAFREQVDADNSRAKLALLDIEANISERTSDNGVLYRVRIGPFSQIDAMNRTRSKLSENSIEAAVVRNQK